MHPLFLAYSGDLDHLASLAMVVGVIAISGYFGMRKRQLWHETARVALEKGQPLPPALANANGRASRYSGPWGLYRGLLLIGIGVGFALVDIPTARRWAALPICIGVAMLLATGVSACFYRRKPSEPQGPVSPQ